MCPTFEMDRIPAVYKWDNRPAINLQGGGGAPESFEGIACYTDGSQIDEGNVGYGSLVAGTEPWESCGNLGPEASVFQGEVVAIQKVCLHLAETLPPTPSRYIRVHVCLLYTSPSPRDKRQSRMPSSA